MQEFSIKSRGAEDLERSLKESKAPLHRFVLLGCTGKYKYWDLISAAALSRPGLQIAQVTHSHLDECPVLAAVRQSTSLRQVALFPALHPADTRGKGGTSSVFRSLTGNSCLTNLDLGCFSGTDVASLDAMLAANNTLCSLDLCDSAVCESLLAAVGHALRTNRRLLDLKMLSMGEDGRGMQSLGEALATN